MLRSGLFKILRGEGIYPVVASQTIRYRRSLAPFARFDVRTQVLGWDDRFIFLYQSFERSCEKVAAAIVKDIFLRKTGGRVPPVELIQLAGLNGDETQLPPWVHQWVESEDAAWINA